MRDSKLAGESLNRWVKGSVGGLLHFNNHTHYLFLWLCPFAHFLELEGERFCFLWGFSFAVNNFMSDDPYQRWPFSSNTFLVWPQMLMVIISMLASSTIWFLPLQQWFRKLLWIFKFQPYTELSRRLVLSYRLFPALQNVTALEFCSIFHEISNLAGLDKRWKIKNWWSVG